MPYSVEHLIKNRLAPVTVGKDDRVVEALKLMIENDFSQLPVIDPQNTPLGMVTYEGILRGVRNFKTQLEDLHVRDVVVPASIFNIEDDLFELLTQLKLTNAVLIINPEGKLAGIVTSFDSQEYFRDRVENIMRIEDIETMIKDLILSAYTLSDGTMDERNLDDAISKLNAVNQIGTTSGQQKSFDELSLGQYISLLLSKHTWDFFEPIFKISRDSLRNLLEEVRKTRNSLAHFRDDISMERSDQLCFCADWLARCQEEFEQTNAQVLFGQLVDAFDQAASQSDPILRGEQENLELSSGVEWTKESETNLQEEIPIIAEEKMPKESRYAPLADFLLSQPGKIDRVQLSFDEIEKIIGGNLPSSAYSHRAWWANDIQSHPQSKMWLDAGWRKNSLNLTKQSVVFTRIRDREKAYIDFFGLLLADMREKAPFQIRDYSPDGSNWVSCQKISSPGYIVAQYSFSFARDQRFRVELYIDTYDQHSTKEVFDQIHAHKDAVENVLGEISWERINDKRASRIAIYHQGAITDKKEKLDVLRKWGVEIMITFYEAINPIALHAIQEVIRA